MRQGRTKSEVLTGRNAIVPVKGNAPSDAGKRNERVSSPGSVRTGQSSRVNRDTTKRPKAYFDGNVGEPNLPRPGLRPRINLRGTNVNK